MKKKLSFSIAACFIWIGFVGGISFLEAWLKFRAPGITVPLGLGIGRLVFNALNKVEWVLALIVLLQIVVTKSFSKTRNFAFYLPLLILILETFWLLPALDSRAMEVIAGADPTPSSLHIYYIAMETTKVISLLTFGFSLLIPVQDK